jgi:hypothetical protein
VQLPVYASCAADRLQNYRGRRWQPAEAAYIAFAGREPYVPIATKPSALAEAIADGQARFVAAVEGIERGEFPPRPAEPYLCVYCPYPGVCRKDFVEAG